MIPRADITNWRNFTSWQFNEQVEQDLVISRSLVTIFSDPYLIQHLAFRGGTALHKLFLAPQARYSEDIDLVQIKEGPVGDILDRLRENLSFLGKARYNQSHGNNTLVFRFESEIPPVINMRLKIEINCREHFNVLKMGYIPFEVKSRWFTGKCSLVSFDLNELLGTKLRALYQRKKGRDLFDIWYASRHEMFDTESILSCYKEYLRFGNVTISRKQFEENMQNKIKDQAFRGDTAGLLRPDIDYDIDEAYNWFINTIFDKY